MFSRVSLVPARTCPAPVRSRPACPLSRPAYSSGAPIKVQAHRRRPVSIRPVRSTLPLRLRRPTAVSEHRPRGARSRLENQMGPETTGQIRLRKATFYRDIEIAAPGGRDERSETPASRRPLRFSTSYRGRGWRLLRRDDAQRPIGAIHPAPQLPPALYITGPAESVRLPLPSPDLPPVAGHVSDAAFTPQTPTAWGPRLSPPPPPRLDYVHQPPSHAPRAARPSHAALDKPLPTGQPTSPSRCDSRGPAHRAVDADGTISYGRST